MPEFKNKVCVVTGSSTGIGFALSEELLKRGAKVYLSGRTPAHVEAARKKLAQYGTMARFDVLNVEDRDETERYIQRIGENDGLDYVFANAGAGCYVPFEQIDWALWDKLINVDLYGVIACAKAAVPIMLQNGGGHFIATSSIAGYAPCPFQSPYNAAKFAVNGIIRTLSYEYASRNIRFSAICPGNVNSGIFERNGLTPPPNAISLEEAVRDIFEGLENDQVIIPVGEVSRRFYENIQKDPAANDAHMKRLAAERGN